MPETKRPGAVGAAPRPKGNDLADQPFITAPPVTTQAAPKSWRDMLPVHPAADLFPLMSPDELKVLGEDINKNGLCEQVAVIDGPDGKPVLIDGRNRLDAMELVGQQFTLEAVAMRLRCQEPGQDFDPYAYVTSINLHRRHLTAEQRRDLIAKLIKATPEKSDRQIAETVKASPTTVGTVRAELEATGDVSKLDTRTDSQGREQPARKTRPERHFCRQCGARAPVGEVQQYNTSDPYYEGDDIWLHDACVAAWEAQEAAARAADRAELDDIEAEMLAPDDDLDGIPPFLRRAMPEEPAAAVPEPTRGVTASDLLAAIYNALDPDRPEEEVEWPWPPHARQQVRRMKLVNKIRNLLAELHEFVTAAEEEAAP